MSLSFSTFTTTTFTNTTTTNNNNNNTIMTTITTTTITTTTTTTTEHSDNLCPKEAERDEAELEQLREHSKSTFSPSPYQPRKNLQKLIKKPLLLDSVSSEDESENEKIGAPEEEAESINVTEDIEVAEDINACEDINVDNWDDWEEGEISPPKLTSTPAAKTNRTSPGSSRTSLGSSRVSPTTPRDTPAISGVFQVSSSASPTPSSVSKVLSSSLPSMASTVISPGIIPSSIKLQLYDSHAAPSPVENIANLTEKCKSQAQKNKKGKNKIKPSVPKYSEPSLYMPSLYWSNLEREECKKMEIQMDIEIQGEHFMDRLIPSNSNQPITFFFSMEGCMVASITCPDMSSISFPMTAFSPVIPITYTTSNTGLLVKLMMGEEVLATGNMILPLIQSLNTNDEV